MMGKRKIHGGAVNNGLVRVTMGIVEVSLEAYRYSEVVGRELLNPEAHTLTLEPTTERMTKWLEHR